MSKAPDDSIWVQLGRYMSLAMALPVATFVGYALGYLLDRWLGTGFLKIVFLLIGIAAGFLELWRGLKSDKP